MKRIIFATTNSNKLKEVRQMLDQKDIQIVGLNELHFEGDIPEDHKTLEENAIQKAEHIYDKYGVPCFSEDTGMEVFSLDGRPGVYSARYAGSNRNAQDNMQKVLSELNGIENRKAQFRTVIAYKTHEDIQLYRGKVTGTIALQPSGKDGFGYDPIFVPDGFDRSFGMLPSAIKNRMSHRAKAWRSLYRDL